MAADETRHGPPDEHGAKGRAAHSDGGHGGGHGGGGHGGGGDHEEHEGAPEWLISFADNVALQMGFFVILLGIAMSQPHGGGSGTAEGAAGGASGAPATDQIDFAIAMRDAFNNPVDLNSTAPEDAPLVKRIVEGRRVPIRPDEEPEEQQRSKARADGLPGAAGTISFALGAATFGDEATPTLDSLADKYKGFNMVIEVRGHCSTQEASTTADNGMSLAYERARAVATALSAKNIPWPRLRLVACGDSEPIRHQAYDDAAQRSNQRVEVIELDAAQQQH